MIRLLLEKGLLPDNKSRRTMLLIGAVSGYGDTDGRKEMADLLIARGVKVNGRIDPDEAVEIGQAEELAKRRESNDSLLDLLDLSTSLIALPRDDMEMTRYLLENGADVNARSRNGYTALSMSVESYLTRPSAAAKERILFLLSNGANPEQNIQVTRLEKKLAPLRKIDFTISDLATVIQDADFVDKLKALKIVPKVTPLTGLLAETLRTLAE
jgi:ankyrin repeat protein